MGNVLKAKINGEWVQILGGEGANIPQTTSLLKGDGLGGVTPAISGTDFQVPLVSGSNIKTINGQDILGSGDLVIQGGTSVLKYGDSIDKPFDFSGKKIGWYGDSIVAGVSSPNLVGLTDCFVKLFSDRVGATFNNHGVSGAKIAAPEGLSSQTLCWHLHGGAASNEDIIIIAGGTNDHQRQVPLGSYGSTDYADFYGALDYICKALQTNNPNTPVIFITPINKTLAVSSEVKSLNDYRNAIFEVATTYGHSVVDGSTIGFPIQRGDASSWAYAMLQDGVHPTTNGHKMYARSLCGKLL